MVYLVEEVLQQVNYLEVEYEILDENTLLYVHGGNTCLIMLKGK